MRLELNLKGDVLNFGFLWIFVDASAPKNLRLHFRDRTGASMRTCIPDGLISNGISTAFDCRQGIENKWARGASGRHQPGNRVIIRQSLQIQGVELRQGVGMKFFSVGRPDPENDHVPDISQHGIGKILVALAGVELGEVLVRQC